MEKGTGRWMQVGRAGPEDLEMEIGGLQEGKEYEFRVKAVNEEGESEPLQTDKAIKAKNPFGTFLPEAFPLSHTLLFIQLDHCII
jgi:hypothetical protein